MIVCVEVGVFGGCLVEEVFEGGFGLDYYVAVHVIESVDEKDETTEPVPPPHTHPWHPSDNHCVESLPDRLEICC